MKKNRILTYISYCSGTGKLSRKVQNPLTGFTEILCEELKANSQNATAKAYRVAVNSLTTYTENKDLQLEDITPELIRGYDSYLINKGLKPNTASTYNRNLRAIFNKAIKRDLISQPGDNPFAGVHTGIYETDKRAMNMDEIRQLTELPAPEEQNRKESLPLALFHALLYFLFCIHARGMSYIDFVFLKKSDITGDSIEYYRRKTKKKMSVFITSPMRQIIERFSGTVTDSPYLFPVINPDRDDEYRQYQTALSLQNRCLGKLRSMAGILRVITTHVARHSNYSSQLKTSKLQE